VLESVQNPDAAGGTLALTATGMGVGDASAQRRLEDSFFSINLKFAFIGETDDLRHIRLSPNTTHPRL
jgi:hypothetical protein